ncbi:Flagellar basal-body rod protein FlgF [Dirofilaria immitis]
MITFAVNGSIWFIACVPGAYSMELKGKIVLIEGKQLISKLTIMPLPVSSLIGQRKRTNNGQYWTTI